MLTPDVLEYILNSLNVHKNLQESVIRDIVRRIIKSGLSPADNLTETTVYQAGILQKAGIVYRDIIKIIAEESDNLYYDVKNAFEAAGIEIFNYDEETLLSNGYDSEIVAFLSVAMKRLWDAALEKTFTEATNLTKTIALTSQTAFISACDLAHMQIASGAFTYGQAIASAAKQASVQGVNVLYPSGASAKLDYAIRRAVLTGVNQTAAKMTEMKADELNHDLMETSAHYGARAEHAEWQGQVVSRSGVPGYLTLADVGYGDVTGIFGANCRHNWFMYFGVPSYTPQQLEDMKNKTVTYNGQEMSVYEARKKQRGFERHVKSTKRELIGLDEAMKNVSDADKAAIKAEFQSSAVKLKQQEARLNDFCKKTGLKRDSFREQVFTTETENEIRSWTKSISQKAVMSAQNYHNKFRFSYGAEILPKSLDKYYDLKYNNPPAYTRLRKYISMVDKGEVSPLVTFEQYQEVALSIEKELFGIVTPNGIEIKGYTAHAVGRVIGHSALNDKFNRSGATITEIKGCLSSGKVGKLQYDMDNRPSWAFKGNGITVSVNPETGEIVQVNRGAK